MDKKTKEALKIAKINNELNESEIKVLESLVPSSSGNGHDFGWTDEYENCGFSKHQMAGYIGSLSKKGYIDIYENDVNGVINGCQFVFTMKGENFLNEIGYEVFVDCNHWND